jgi:hypothetical protein
MPLADVWLRKCTTVMRLFARRYEMCEPFPRRHGAGILQERQRRGAIARRVE